MSDSREPMSKALREERARRLQAEGVKAREDYVSEIEARDANTARLKAMRLERDRVAALETPADAPAAKTRARRPGAASRG